MDLKSKHNHFEIIWKQAVKYQRTESKKSKSSYIIGGIKSSNEEFPSVVALISDSGRSFCTGNLIAPDIIATAGHCVLSLFEDDLMDSRTLRKYLDVNDHSLNKNEITKAVVQVLSDNRTNIHIRVNGINQFNMIQSIAVSDSWKEWNADAAYYQLTGNREIRFTSTSVSDKAIIKLNKKITGIHIPQIISSSEMTAVKMGNYKKAVQVGYGFIKDPSSIEIESASLALTKANLEKMRDQKYRVELPINTIFEGAEDFKVGIGKPGKATCYGDSGGPTFVQLNNSQWRYFASLSKSISNHVLCGQNDSSAWADSASEDKKQTTDIGDVWVM